MRWFSGSNVRTIVVSGGVAAVTALANVKMTAIKAGTLIKVRL